MCWSSLHYFPFYVIGNKLSDTLWFSVKDIAIQIVTLYKNVWSDKLSQRAFNYRFKEFLLSGYLHFYFTGFLTFFCKSTKIFKSQNSITDVCIKDDYNFVGERSAPISEDW